MVISDDNQGGGGGPCVEPAALDLPSDGALGLHVVDVADAANVSLEEDGTFHGTLFGCDFGDHFRGRWAVYQTSLLLLPNPGEELEWFDRAEPVHFVRLMPIDDAFILAEAVRPSGSTFIKLAEGRICACCGSQGPLELRPCDGPLPEAPWGAAMDCRGPCVP